jgi:hypothetical protein
MKRPVRGADGKYHVHGKSYKELFGSRQQVHNQTAYKTDGGLTKSDLMMNKWGRIVSVKKHRTAKKEKRLEKAGYFAKKGKFGYVKKGAKTRKARGSRKMKGGACKDGYDIGPDCPTEERLALRKAQESSSSSGLPTTTDSSLKGTLVSSSSLSKEDQAPI